MAVQHERPADKLRFRGGDAPSRPVDRLRDPARWDEAHGLAVRHRRVPHDRQGQDLGSPRQGTAGGCADGVCARGDAQRSSRPDGPLLRHGERRRVGQQERGRELEPRRAVPAVRHIGARRDDRVASRPLAILFAFGDSVFDCGHYNKHGVTPQALLARNDDRLFPEFRGRDLWTVRGNEAVTVVQSAVDGATSADLERQISIRSVPRWAIVMLSIGGNDLIQALPSLSDAELGAFPRLVRDALERLAHAKLFVANVYDPSFRDDSNNFLGVDPATARLAHGRVNEILALETTRVGACLVDLHAHFLSGRPSWFTRQIEPSLTGASEIRRVFLDAIVRTNAAADL